MADEGRISDLDRFKALREQAQSVEALETIFKFSRPFLKSMGVDVASVQTAFEDLRNNATVDKLEALATLADRFNDRFADRAWIMYDGMNTKVAEEAIAAFDEDPDHGEQILVDHYNKQTIEGTLVRMKSLKSFLPRLVLARAALDDYLAERYHACVPVVLALIDGMVQDAHIGVHGTGGNMSAEKTELLAWDSVAAHPTGLGRLKTIITSSRKTTRTDPIAIPYRHGIMHGMDLGYANKTVAAKCWAALFAVSDWARAAEKGELAPPPDSDETPGDVLASALSTMAETEAIKKRAESWSPRIVVVGQDCPAAGAEEEFAEGTPERTVARFMNAWGNSNYGWMAESVRQEQPQSIRDLFQHFKLATWKIRAVEERSLCLARAQVEVSATGPRGEYTTIADLGLLLADKTGDAVLDGNGYWQIQQIYHLLRPPG